MFTPTQGFCSHVLSQFPTVSHNAPLPLSHPQRFAGNYKPFQILSCTPRRAFPSVGGGGPLGLPCGLPLKGCFSLGVDNATPSLILHGSLKLFTRIYQIIERDFSTAYIGGFTWFILELVYEKLQQYNNNVWMMESTSTTIVYRTGFTAAVGRE